MGRARTPLAVRFEVKVVQGSGCYGWSGSTNPDGYGQIRDPDRGLLGAHVVAWELAHGPVPPGKVVRHSCDNPPCTREDHLLLGSKRDNTRDAVVRGRIATGERHGSRTSGGPWGAQRPENARALRAHRAQGTRKANAKLTDDAVREIRRRATEGESQRALAGAFGVSQPTIHRVTHGGWRHVA